VTVADAPTATAPHVRPSATGGARVQALDGVRALGLVLIMAFHFGVGWLPAGFVGVDVFYVLSGYLITGLLLGEWARTARIRLGAFWARRARRLLPALAVVLVVVTLVVRFTYPAGLYPDLRMADLSALFYFSNWWQIAASGNYFVATGAISPLTHTWSLAVEEQFYLVWPLVVLGVLHLARRVGARPPRPGAGDDGPSDPGTTGAGAPVRAGRPDRGVEALLALSVAGVVASATEMAVLYRPGVDITRLYFGTDTHAQSILVGAVLACVLTLVQRHRGLAGMAPVARSGAARVGLTVLGLAGLAGTAVLTATVAGTDAVAYRGGFLVSALSAAALITGAVCVAGGPIARVLSVGPMVWMGTVSYGAYLWHFPVFIELDGARTGLGGAGLVALRLAVTFALAAASYYLVERPVMEGVFWRSLRAAGPALAAVAATVVVVVAGTVAPATAAAPATGTGTVPVGERQALDAAHAFSSDPVRFLLVGDSLAVTTGLGLVRGSVDHFGVRVINKGVLGCDLDDLDAVSSGQRDIPVSDCRHWQALWGAEVERYRPEVAGLLAGRFMITDHFVDGRVVTIDQPAWNHHLELEMDQVVAVLSARGAKVVLFTMPYLDPPAEAPDGSVYPENRTSRVDEYNAILRRVAASHPGVVTVIDLNRLLDPQGHFATVVDGVPVRWADGIHVTRAGGQWLEPSVLPTIARLGLEVRAAGTS
jgi:peptidoglycan/LPS O-acetylase OafA/YrhL